MTKPLGEVKGIKVLNVQKQTEDNSIMVTFEQNEKNGIFRFREETCKDGKINLEKFATDGLGLSLLTKVIDLKQTGLPGAVSVSFLLDIINKNSGGKNEKPIINQKTS
ncbi:hypothetical protein K8R66_03240 [bacterium]|nr:hypothetical protein [bacterium]